ncbi:hypothetical protein [uncultured Ligilactobacillus sp.]|uniref:hypothetical protein n=1 Tax=uncultured Ligilactobacillus sp. TaxID=2837633 RepID=UPI00272B7A4E|nr:hypothetical protein [uncultured Ligilactobacillus sp.]
MNKFSKITVALLCTVVLAGCSNNNEKSTAKEQTTSKVAKKSSSQAQSSTSQADKSAQSSSEEKAAASESSTTDPNQAEANKLSNNELIQQGAISMRQNLGDTALVATLSGKEDSQKKVSVSYSGDLNNYTANYYLEKDAKPVNDESLKDKSPYATLTKKTYGSTDEAASQIDYQNDTSQGNLPKISLGYGLQATVNSGAGQRYLHWNEGNWSFTMHGSPVANEDPVVAARKAVTLLERYRLPAPTQRGNGRLETSNKAGFLTQSLTWNKDNVVYEFKADDLETLVLVAASLQ